MAHPEIDIKHPPLHCGFCAKTALEVLLLVRGEADACICDECIKQAMEIILRSYTLSQREVHDRNGEIARHIAGYRRTKKEVIPQSVAKEVFERDEYRCRHCGTHIDLTVDHIFPESLGGEVHLDNLQTLCRSCNSKKGVKVMEAAV